MNEISALYELMERALRQAFSCDVVVGVSAAWQFAEQSHGMGLGLGVYAHFGWKLMRIPTIF